MAHLMFSLTHAVMGKHLCTPVQKAVLVSLADRANKNYECFPSHRDIVERTGFKDRAVRAALRDLEAAGLISMEVRADPHGRQTSNRYTLHPGKISRLPDAEVDATPPCTRCHLPRHQVPPHKNQSYEAVATGEQVLLPTQALPMNVIDIRTRQQMDPQSVFDELRTTESRAEHPSAAKPRGNKHRSTRPIADWTIVDVVFEYGLQAQYHFPMRPMRTNTQALGGAFGKLRTEIPDYSPELALAMVDLFLADKRRIADGLPLWQQFIASWSRLVPAARLALASPRGDRQGSSTSDATRYAMEDSGPVLPTAEDIAAKMARYLPVDGDGNHVAAVGWGTHDEENS